jgi:hypothetical protein
MDHLDMIYNTTDGKTMAGGYSVNSILLNEQQPAIYNTSKSGGKSKVSVDKVSADKVSERFKHLAVPAGLLYINDTKNINTNTLHESNDIINNELYEKLLSLAQERTSDINKQTSNSKKTKRNNKKNKKNKKTKRNNKI